MPTEQRELILRGPITLRPERGSPAAVMPQVGAVSISARRIVLLSVTCPRSAGE